MAHAPRNGPALIIVADDYGYAPRYDEGILEVARAGALDAVSVMVGAQRRPDVAPLLPTGVEIGLHLEEYTSVADQLARFGELFRRDPAYLDGHHHCHAAPRLAADVARLAAERTLAVRSIDERHRQLLRDHGVVTPDRLVGRLSESEPALPAEVSAILVGGSPPPGTTEWMVHPGYATREGGSDYDAGREEDLALLLELAGREEICSLRTTHASLR